MIDENRFIAARKPDWEELRRLLESKRRSYIETRRMGHLYRCVAEDLSFASTHFPESDTTGWLNGLIRNCHLSLFRQEGFHLKNLIRFYTHRFPELIIKIGKPILLSLVLFLTCSLLAFGISFKETKKAEMFLSPQIYEKALKDLEERKQFGNFDDINRTERPAVSLYIWFNNSMVSIYCLVLGITFGIGTFAVLVLNSLMLGGLSSFYWLNGSFIDFSTLIMIHGSIELPAIIIAGGAGFHIASAILFPGRFSRKDLIKKNAQEALLILGGVISMLCVAGLIEGFITPLKPGLPIRSGIIALNLILLALYIVRGMILTSRDKHSQPAA